jgi:hypothetical protein
MANIEWNVDAEKGEVRVTFPTDPPATLLMDTNDVVEMLELLGKARVTLKPPVPQTSPPGPKFVSIGDPLWRCENEPMNGDSLLHLRDPRYGWLHFLLPRASAKHLGGVLIRQADAVPLAQPPNKAS